MGRRLLLFAPLLLGAEPLHAVVSAPVQKWAYGGCIAGPYCQTGWYSSPAVADLDGDGQPDVIWGAYDVWSLNGTTGAIKWRGPNGSRVWPGIAVADLTGDGTKEVIVGRSGDQVTVYDRFGTVVWTRNPFGSGEVRTLAVADLETDGQLEVVVGRASGGDTKQLSVYEPNGTVRPGWPARRDFEVGYGWGMYNQNVAVADMNADGFREIFGPTDTHYITALDRGGNQLSTNAIYNPINPSGPKVWSQVGVHVDHAVDLRGYAMCGTEHRPNFANSAPVVGDLNGDGVPELVVIGNVYNCLTDPYTDLYEMPFILKLDRTRWSGSGFDWTVIPPDPGASGRPRSEDYNVIENSVPNPALADLDGDGFKEIVYPSYDGKMHAYWLDKTQHGSWPYTIPTTGGADDFRFASEPVIADLDNDGHAEVIFTTWPKKSPSGLLGQLIVLNYLGVELFRMNLPGASYNGGLGAPTIANIDADADLELVVGTIASGVVAYDLPNSANARILWGTGRGSYRRTGSLADVPFADLSITKSDGQTTAFAGIPVTYTITVANNGPGAVAGAAVTDNFPAAVTSASWSCSASAGGSCGVASGSGNIAQTVNLPPGGTATYLAVVNTSAGATGSLSNTATVAVPAGITDPVSGNNSATDIDTLLPAADLSITKSDGRATASPGQVITYTIVVFNAGPNAANGATVTDTIPASLLAATWTCVGANGGTCTPVGASSINDSAVNLPMNGSVTYTLTGTVGPNPSNLRNTATVAVPAGMGDPSPANNTATDDDVLICFGETVIVPDGRIGSTTLGATTTAWFGAALRIGNSYSLEFKNATGDSTPPGVLTVYSGDDGCSQTSTITPRPTTTIDPGAGAASQRVSFTTSGTETFFRARLVNILGIAIPLSLTWSDTTMYSPAWSTNGAFNAYYSFQNTTGASVSGTLTLLDTTGAVVSTFAVPIPAGQTASTNTSSLSVTRNRTGTARFTHDGPPGAVIAEAAIANFSITPSYVQPVQFKAVREAR